MRGETFVVSSSTSEERTSQGYRGNNGERRQYKPGNSGSENNRTYNESRQDSRTGSNVKNRDFRNSEGDSRPPRRFNKDSDYNQSKDNRSGNNHGKDFKRSYNNSKDFSGRNDEARGDGRSGSRTNAQKKDGKVREQQPEKVDIVKRLEKEKKVMKKKSAANNHKEKNARPQVKIKRTNNIDWTKEYENDSFDDDDAFFMY